LDDPVLRGSTVLRHLFVRTPVRGATVARQLEDATVVRTIDDRDATRGLRVGCWAAVLDNLRFGAATRDHEHDEDSLHDGIRNAIFSAARVASAMIVICGFTPSDVGTAAPSTT
jgi:hypothetical protein